MRGTVVDSPAGALALRGTPSLASPPTLVSPFIATTTRSSSSCKAGVARGGGGVIAAGSGGAAAASRGAVAAVAIDGGLRSGGGGVAVGGRGVLALCPRPLIATILRRREESPERGCPHLPAPTRTHALQALKKWPA